MRRKQTFSDFEPIVGDEQILDFIHSLNGEYKHDREIMQQRNIPKSVGDVIRRVFGKVKHKKYIHPQELKDKICQEYRDGIAIKKIAESHGLSVGSIESILTLNGVEKNRNQPWSKIQKMRLVHMRDVQKLTWKELGEYFGKSLSACEQQYKYIKGIQPRQKRKQAKTAA